MGVSDSEISGVVASYLECHPGEAEVLSQLVHMLAEGGGFASRRSFPMHVTVGALLVRGGDEILLVDHRAYGIMLQPGGHLEPADASLMEGAVRELAEETGVEAAEVVSASPSPVYIEYGRVPARPEKDEPAHYHLDIGYAFTTMADAGPIQTSEVRTAGWYPLAVAERLVGERIRRATGPAGRAG